ncbi:MAG: hypothetical protein HDS39_00335 [Bacteroides sp.]|nr:hypothetical protein [Bacteroides sp.]
MLHFRLFLSAALLACILAIPAKSHADVIAPKDTVTGTVIGRHKEPIPGAKVEIVGQPYSVFTDIDGHFNIKCDQGARKVLVSYPKARNVKKNISRDMTVQIGKSWRQAPENYQWFFGAGIGAGYTYNEIDLPGYPDPHGYYGYYEEEFWSPTLSVMIGRVKAVGWYVKGFVNFPSKGHNCWISKSYDDHYVGMDSSGIKTSTFGAILGGMVRLGCPLHLLIGVGVGHSRLDGAEMLNLSYYPWSWQGDLGLLFRIKNHCGISLNMNIGATRRLDITHGSFMNLGFEYFLNK